MQIAASVPKTRGSSISVVAAWWGWGDTLELQQPYQRNLAISAWWPLCFSPTNIIKCCIVGLKHEIAGIDFNHKRRRFPGLRTTCGPLGPLGPLVSCLRNGCQMNLVLSMSLRALSATVAAEKWSIRRVRCFLTQMLHGAGIFTIIYLHNWVMNWTRANVGIHIPAPWVAFG